MRHNRSNYLSKTNLRPTSFEVGHFSLDKPSKIWYDKIVA